MSKDSGNFNRTVTQFMSKLGNHDSVRNGTGLLSQQHSHCRHDVFFFHIPKTAGTSFNDFMVRRFAPENVFLGKRYQEVIKQNSKHGLYYSGHTNWDLVEKIPPHYKKIIMLRNPAKRLESAYYFVKEAPGEIEKFRPYARAAKQYSYKNWLKFCVEAKGNEDGDINNSDNHYARCLLGRRSCGHLPRLDLDKDIASFDLASERLMEFDICGVVEHFADALSLTANALQVEAPNQEELPALNINRKSVKDEVDDEAVDLINELTKYDQILYQKALALFSQQYKEHVGVGILGRGMVAGRRAVRSLVQRGRYTGG